MKQLAPAAIYKLEQRTGGWSGGAAQPQAQLRNVVGRRRSIAMQQRRYARGPNSRRIVPPLSSTSRLVMTPRIAIGLAPSTSECRAVTNRYAGGIPLTPNGLGRPPSPRNAFSPWLSSGRRHG